MYLEVKTNYGTTYIVTEKEVAADYANTAIQFEDNLKTWDELYQDIVTDEKWLSEWYGDYIRYDLELIDSYCEVKEVDEHKKAQFFGWAWKQFGQEID